MKTISQSPTEKEFVQDPYARYAFWRDDPFVFWQEYGFPVSARFSVVNKILRDRRFGREAPEGFAPSYPDHLQPFYDFESRSMLEREPPVHTRLRALVLRAFTSRRIAALEDEIRTLANALIDRFPQEPFDILPPFAEKIPVIVIARMIGVHEEDSDQLLAWSHDMVAMYQAGRTREIEDRAVSATLEFSDYIRRFAEARRKSPQDDLLSHLIAAESDGEKLSMDELITTSILLLNAGHEATVHAIGNGLNTLLAAGINPLEYDLANVIEETLRIDPPLHMFTRFAMEDIEIEGHKFSRGDIVGLLLGAANHDPEKYPDPARFDPTRKAQDQLGFGAGLHFCIGAPLARLELKIALEALFERHPQLARVAPPVYADRYHFHGLEALWIKV